MPTTRITSPRPRDIPQPRPEATQQLRLLQACLRDRTRPSTQSRGLPGRALVSPAATGARPSMRLPGLPSSSRPCRTTARTLRVRTLPMSLPPTEEAPSSKTRTGPATGGSIPSRRRPSDPGAPPGHITPPLPATTLAAPGSRERSCWPVATPMPIATLGLTLSTRATLATATPLLTTAMTGISIQTPASWFDMI